MASIGDIKILNDFNALMARPLDARHIQDNKQGMFDYAFKYEGAPCYLMYDAQDSDTGKLYLLKNITLCKVNGVQANTSEWGKYFDHWAVVGAGVGDGGNLDIDAVKNIIGGTLVDSNSIDHIYDQITKTVKSDVRIQNSPGINLTIDSGGVKATPNFGTASNQIAAGDHTHPVVTALANGIITPVMLAEILKVASKVGQAEIDTAINNLLGGVTTAGNTLKKLYDLIVDQRVQITVDDIAARNALNITTVGAWVFVKDTDSVTTGGQWGMYRANQLGVSTNYTLLFNEGSIEGLSASEIKILYESNPDTNAFTDAYQTKLDGAVLSVNGIEPDAEGNVDTSGYDDTYTVVVTNPVGRHTLGTYAGDIKDALDKILQKPFQSAVATMSPSVVFEKGTTYVANVQGQLVLNDEVTVTNRRLEKSGLGGSWKTFSTNTFAYTDNLTIATTYTFKADVANSGAPKTVSATQSFTPVAPTFYGVSNTNQPVEAEVESKTKQIWAGQGANSYREVTFFPNNQRCVFAEPQANGIRSVIEDQNGFNATAGFDRLSATYTLADGTTSELYYVYVSKNNGGNGSAFKYKFYTSKS